MNTAPISANLPKLSHTVLAEVASINLVEREGKDNFYFIDFILPIESQVKDVIDNDMIHAVCSASRAEDLRATVEADNKVTRSYVLVSFELNKAKETTYVEDDILKYHERTQYVVSGLGDISTIVALDLIKKAALREEAKLKAEAHAKLQMQQMQMQMQLEAQKQNGAMMIVQEG
jgi:hypothetical protein